MELFKAARQWMTRPDDERFATLEEMHAACEAYHKSAVTAKLPYSKLRVVPGRDNEVVLAGGTGATARMSNWSFGQLCGLAGAPAGYLRTLPAELAAPCINEGLERNRDDMTGEAHLMFHRNGGLLARAVTTDMYKRIWNAQITNRLLPLQDNGWRVPPARPSTHSTRGVRRATKADVLNAGNFGLSVKVGDMIAPAGLYASDHDMFAFMVDPTKAVGKGNDLMYRGFFIWNSEVGAASFGIMTFLWRHVCGNHIVWGAQGVQELRIRHVGNADERAFSQISIELRKYADSSASDDNAKIADAKRFILGSNQQEVIELVRGKVKTLGVGDAEAAWELAVKHDDTDGNPHSAWGFANGLTRLSQETAFGDKRVALDRTAGKVLEIAF